MPLFLLLALATPALAEPAAQPDDRIIVTGNRAEEAELAADAAKAITYRPPAGKPLPKHYEPACIKLFGLDPDFADVLAERMRDNLRALNIPLGRAGCTPTIWVGFVSDSHAAVTSLRQTEPRMFGDLHDYEIDRILAGSKAAQAWFAREDKGVDGKPMKYVEIEIGGVKRVIKQNDQWNASRITSTIRVDMIGSIVIFDRALSAGRTIRQLADYATFRALAPVKELADEADNPPSILSLFAESGTPPTGFTEFDWSYLSAYYKLGEGAEAASMHDAAKRAFLDGAGQNKAEKTGVPVAD
jgi:hypothetical protein